MNTYESVDDQNLRIILAQYEPAGRSRPVPGNVRTWERDTMSAAVVGLTVATHIEITGEPGIGKTRMLTEISAVARAQGHLVLSGGASTAAADTEFDAFVDAIDGHVAGLCLDALPPRVRRTLTEIFPSFPRVVGDGAHLGAGRPLHAIRLLLETIAAARPLVVLLDDLHLADSRTVDLICYLLRSPPQAPVLFASAYRPRQARARLRQAFSGAAAALRLSLQPLSVAQIRALIGDSVSAAECRTLHRDSGGVPLYLEAMLDRRANADDRAADARIVTELEHLSPHARLAAAAAAIVGDDFGLPDVAAVAELPEAAIYAAIDELVGGDLVRELAEPARFAFRHPVVRQAIYHAAPPGWRIGALTRTGQAPVWGPGAPAAPREAVRARPSMPLERLTSREQQAARLVADGMTNREIAAELFVTEKTVEMHLSNLFTKLEVRNRVGVARAVLDART